MSDPLAREPLVEAVAQVISTTWPDGFDVVVSPDTASLVLSSLVAEHLRHPLAYLRPAPKQHGMRKQVEGALKQGDRALLLIHSPDALARVADSVDGIASLGARFVGCLSVGRELDAATRAFLDEGQIRHNVVSAVPSQREQHKRAVANALLDVGAVVINRARPFRYASGLLSPIYTDCRLLMSHPGAWRVVVDAFLDLLGQTTGVSGVDALAGTATSGIPHASVLANRLQRPLVYVTFEDAKEGRVEGKVETGDRVVMIEDHISTGSSVLASAAVLRSRGARVDWCLAIFTYGYPVARANFDKQRMTFETLCDLETLLVVATERGDIDEDQKQAVLEWRADPQGWTTQEEARLQDRSNADGV